MCLLRLSLRRGVVLGATGHVSSGPDASAEWWTTSDVAAYLGVRVTTVTNYRKRGQSRPRPERLLDELAEGATGKDDDDPDDGAAGVLVPASQGHARGTKGHESSNTRGPAQGKGL
jgi:hypothetical protein